MLTACLIIAFTLLAFALFREIVARKAAEKALESIKTIRIDTPPPVTIFVPPPVPLGDSPPLPRACEGPALAKQAQNYSKIDDDEVAQVSPGLQDRFVPVGEAYERYAQPPQGDLSRSEFIGWYNGRDCWFGWRFFGAESEWVLGITLAEHVDHSVSWARLPVIKTMIKRGDKAEWNKAYAAAYKHLQSNKLLPRFEVHDPKSHPVFLGQKEGCDVWFYQHYKFEHGGRSEKPMIVLLDGSDVKHNWYVEELTEQYRTAAAARPACGSKTISECFMFGKDRAEEKGLLA